MSIYSHINVSCLFQQWYILHEQPFDLTLLLINIKKCKKTHLSRLTQVCLNCLFSFA